MDYFCRADKKFKISQSRSWTQFNPLAQCQSDSSARILRLAPRALRIASSLCRVLPRANSKPATFMQATERHRFSRDRSFSRFNGTDVSKSHGFRYIDYFCRADEKFKISQNRSARVTWRQYPKRNSCKRFGEIQARHYAGVISAKPCSDRTRKRTRAIASREP